MGKEDTVRKGVPNGYAPLRSSGLIPNEHISSMLQDSVFDDLVLPMIVRVTGVGRPNLGSFVGNILQYVFAINDNAEIEATEVLHGWKEGSAIELHVHWATGGLNDGTVRGVKWEIEYSWANMLYIGGTTVFGAPTTVSMEDSIAAAEPDRTHRFTHIMSFTPAGGKVGMYLILRLKRIASVTNPAPVADPFGLSLGVHYEIDTLGSRTLLYK